MTEIIELERWSELPWYIFIPGGQYAYVIGKTGQYESEIDKALPFYEWIDALTYVEKHGYEKIATIRKVIV